MDSAVAAPAKKNPCLGNRTALTTTLEAGIGRLHGTLLAAGPGLITGAADDDPSGIATYSQGGAQFGFNLLMDPAAHLPADGGDPDGQRPDRARHRPWPGEEHGRCAAGLAGDRLVALLFLANTINVGADLAAMGEAAKLVTGFNEHAFTIGFALLSLACSFSCPIAAMHGFSPS